MNILSDNYPMVMLAEDWGKHPSSSQHLARELAKFHDITWVNSIGLRAPRLNLSDMGRVFKKIQSMLTYHSHTSPHTLRGEEYWQPQIIDPMAIPFHGQGWARWLNQKLISRKLFDVLEKNSSEINGRDSIVKEKPILWLSLPSAMPLLGKINECFSIYYCGDDFSALEGVDHDVISKLEDELVKKVDLIIVASERLSKKFPSDKTIFIPHGVADYFYEAPDERPCDLPEGPVAGFYGSLSGWVDQQLLIRTARKMRHWNFVIIGPQRCFVEHLKREPNIYLLGAKDHRELPNYIHHWQVSLLPFKNNAQIRACNPLKLREYMAVGKPIVSTDFPALHAYKDWVSIAKGDAFAAAIEQAAAEIPKAKELMLNTAGIDFFSAIDQWSDIDKIRRVRQRRASQVGSHTWQARALKIEREILKRIQLDRLNLTHNKEG